MNKPDGVKEHVNVNVNVNTPRTCIGNTRYTTYWIVQTKTSKRVLMIYVNSRLTYFSVNNKLTKKRSSQSRVITFLQPSYINLLVFSVLHLYFRKVLTLVLTTLKSKGVVQTW